MTLPHRVSVKFCRNKITASFFHTLFWSLKKVLWRPLRWRNKEGWKENLLLISTPHPGVKHLGLILKISNISTIPKFGVKTRDNLRRICYLSRNLVQICNFCTITGNVVLRLPILFKRKIFFSSKFDHSH